VRFLRGHKKAVYCLTFLADGRLASGGLEGEVCVWDIAAGSRRTVADGAGRVEWLASSPDGAWLAWCGDGPWVGVAKPQDGGQWLRVKTQEERPYPPRAVACAFSPDGGTLLSVGGGPRCWRVADWAPVRWADEWWGQRATDCLAFAPDAATVATGACMPERGNTGWTVCLWETRTGTSRPAFPVGHPFDGDLTFTNLAYSPNGRVLAGTCTSELRVWVAETGEVLYRWDSAAGPIHGLAFSPDGRLLVTGGNDGAVTLRDASTWAESSRYDWKLGNVQDVAFSPDGMLLGACGSRGKIVVWDVDV
jgi:WD40 repeat protein